MQISFSVCVLWLSASQIRQTIVAAVIILTAVCDGCVFFHVTLYSNNRPITALYNLNLIVLKKFPLFEPEASIPKYPQWCISPYFRFPSYFSFFLFPKVSLFIQNIRWPFLVIYSQFVIYPYFRIFDRPTFPFISDKKHYFRFHPTFSPIFAEFTCFCLICVFLASPILTLMDLCIIQDTYWTPLVRV